MSRAWRVARREGAASFWFKLCSSLGYRRLVLYELSLSDFTGTFTLPPGITLEALTEANLADYLDFRPDLKPAEVGRRFQRRHLCFCARHRGRVLAASWVALEQAWIDYLAWELPLSQGDAYVYDAFTREEWGRTGLGASLSAHVTQQLLERGVNKSWRAIMPENSRAVALQAKLGSRAVFLLRTLHLGPLIWSGRSFLPQPPGSAPATEGSRVSNLG